MSLYLDSSALVKRYLQEPGSDRVTALVGGTLAATAVVTLAEITSAIIRARRLGRISARDADAARESVSLHWAELVRLDVDDDLARRAAEVAWRHPLRGFDAVHLAAALTLRDLLQEEVVLATFGRELWIAAREAGLAPWPDGLVP